MIPDDRLRKTVYLNAIDEDLIASSIRLAADLLQQGGLVALPTETVYGLGANALDIRAVESIFVAKQRPHWDPLIVHISDDAMLREVVRDVPERARLLMDRFWPGPLTLLLPRNLDLPLAVTAGRDLVGVRMPSHPVAHALIDAAGVPIAAPSANLFGHISPTTAAHVLADLDGRIDAVLDAGPCAIGLESTVLDPNTSPMVLYRQGGISLRQIVDVAGPVIEYSAERSLAAEPASLPSPGTGIRHYAPRANLLLASSREQLAVLVASSDPHTASVLLPLGWRLPQFTGTVHHWEAWNDPAALAATLYAGLRALDDLAVQTILCPLPEPTGNDLSDALRDRLIKAARKA